MMLTTQEDLCLNSNYLMGQETFFCFLFLVIFHSDLIHQLSLVWTQTSDGLFLSEQLMARLLIWFFMATREFFDRLLLTQTRD